MACLSADDYVCMGSVEVAARGMQDEVIGFRLFLLGSRQLEELHVVVGVVLAVNQLVDFLFAVHYMGIALEQALTHVVEDGQAKGLDLVAGLFEGYTCSA